MEKISKFSRDLEFGYNGNTHRYKVLNMLLKPSGGIIRAVPDTVRKIPQLAAAMTIYKKSKVRTCSSGSTQLFGVKPHFLENPQMTSN